MPLLLGNPTNCEIHDVIHFLNAKGVKAAKIHHNVLWGKHYEQWHEMELS